jgi:hypothetical protein
MFRPQLTAHPRSQVQSYGSRRGYRVTVIEQAGGVTLQVYHHQKLVGEGKGLSLSTTTFWLQDIAIANQVPRPLGPGWLKACLGGRSEWSQPINYRGRGLGSVLLRCVIAYTRERGFQSVQGQVFRADLENTPYLLQWYRQHGFQVLAVTERDPPDLVARLWMSLTVPEAESVPPSASFYAL